MANFSASVVDDTTARNAGFSSLQDWRNQTGRTAAESMSSNNASTTNVVDTAKQLQQLQITANQPAIQTLQSSIDPLKSRYNDLIASIKGAATVASNFAQQGASMDLGRRGLMPQSQEGQTAIGQALLPVTAQTQSQLSQTGLGENQDIATINNAIAQLQGGNMPGAISTASNLAGLQQQASQFAQTLPIQQQQANFISIPNIGVYDVKNQKLLGGYSTSPYNIFNPTTGNAIVGQ